MRMDPPRHRKLRGLVSQAFTRRMVAGLEPRIAEVTTELLDATGGGERLDLIESLAYPLPVIVIAELLGYRPPTGRPSAGGPTRFSTRPTSTPRTRCRRSARRRWPRWPRRCAR